MNQCTAIPSVNKNIYHSTEPVKNRKNYQEQENTTEDNCWNPKENYLEDTVTTSHSINSIYTN